MTSDAQRGERDMTRKLFWLSALLVLATVTMMAGRFLLGRAGSIWWAGLAIALVLAPWAVMAVTGRTLIALCLVAGSLLLAPLFAPARLIVATFPNREAMPFDGSMALAILGTITIAVMVAALLFYSGIVRRRVAPDSVAGPIALVLAALLVVKALHSLYWFMVWDTTNDPLGFIWLILSIPLILLAGFGLVGLLPGRTKAAALLVVLLIPAAMIFVTEMAQRVDFRQLTEARAERATRAIDVYNAREGRYPESMRQLAPRDALALPGPVILYGQSWCYEGGGDSYRLGYVYREHWSDPNLSGRLYSAAGDWSESDPMCGPQIAALEARFPDFFGRDRN